MQFGGQYALPGSVLPPNAENPFGNRRYVPATSTIQSAIDAAVSGDIIYVAPGEYDEELTIPATLDNLTIIGTGGRGAAFVAPSAANGIALTCHGRDVTIVNLGCDGEGTGGGALVTGRRFRAFGCKFEGGAYGLKIGPGTAAQITAATRDKGDDSLFEDCEFAWTTDGAILADSDYGAVTQPRFRRCVFHNVTNGLTELTTGGSVGSRDIEVRECSFLRAEDGTPATKYLNVDHANTTGAVFGCFIAHATNASAVQDLAAGVLYMANATEAGMTTARPS